MCAPPIRTLSCARMRPCRPASIGFDVHHVRACILLRLNTSWKKAAAFPLAASDTHLVGHFQADLGYASPDRLTSLRLLPASVDVGTSFSLGSILRFQAGQQSAVVEQLALRRPCLLI